MDKWEERFRCFLSEMNKQQLTETVDCCFKMANTLSGVNYTTNKHKEREIRKKKAKIAIEVRDE